MNKRYIVFNANGLIISNPVLPEGGIAVNVKPGDLWLQSDELVDFEKQYVLQQKIVERPKFNLQIPAIKVPVNSEFCVSNIPFGTTVIHPGGVSLVNDGYIEWESNVPGNFRFYFMKFPYQEVEIYAQVTEA